MAAFAFYGQLLWIERPEKGNKPHTEYKTQDVQRQSYFHKVTETVASQSLYNEVCLVSDGSAETA